MHIDDRSSPTENETGSIGAKHSKLAHRDRASGIRGALERSAGRAMRHHEFRFDAHTRSPGLRMWLRVEGLYRTTWVPHRFELRERLGESYRLVLTLGCERTHPTSLLGKSVSLLMRYGDRARAVHGIVASLECGEWTEERKLARLEIVPAFDALRHSQQSRIFRDARACEILARVLGAELRSGYGRSFRFDLTRERLTRAQCTQRRESNLDFALRLFEEEGLFPYFEQGDESYRHETLVITDSNELLPSYGEVDFDVFGDGELYIDRFAPHHRIGITDVQVADLVWSPAARESSEHETDPRFAERVADERSDSVSEPVMRESFEADQRFVYEWDEHGVGRSNLAAQASWRQQAHRVDQEVFVGSGHLPGLHAGARIRLRRHPNPSWNGEYVIIAVSHQGAISSAAEHGVTCSFECIPAGLPFRLKRRTQTPAAAGVELARVVRVSPSTAWVRFHWDRNRQEICAPVVPAEAPAPGDLVAVGFVGGDPDRPIVLGVVPER